MTYSVSGPLQTAIYDQLINDPGVSALVGTHVYDAPLPLDAVAAPEDYVTLGAETARDRSSKTTRGAVHDLTVRVHSGAQGYARSKAIAGAVCDALLDASLTLSRGDVVYLRFLKARASADGAPRRREIVLQFRAFVEDT